MSASKFVRTVSFFSVIFIPILCEPAAAQADRDWKSYTSVGDIRDAAVSGNSVWIASDGGVVEFSVSASGFTVFTNTEGLTQNPMRGIKADRARNRIVAAGADGSLNFFSTLSREWFADNALSGAIIQSLAVSGDSLFIATGESFILYRLDSLSVTGVATRLGTLPAQTGVLFCAADRNYIWCMTATAVARSNRYNTNFQAPASWTVYSNQSGLTSGSMKSIAVYRNRFYVSTNNRQIFRYNEISGLFEQITTGLPTANYTLLSANEELYAYHSGAVYRLNIDTWENISLTLADSTGKAFDLTIFAGKINDKFVLLNDRGEVCVQGNPWKCFTPNAPRANYFSGLKFDAQGRLWCSSLSAYGFSGPGFYCLDTKTGNWENFHSSILPGLPTNNFQNITVDDSGKIWLGSWSHGLAVFNPQNGTVQVFNAQNGLDAMLGLCPQGVTMINNVFKGPGKNIFISVQKPCGNEKALCIYNQTENQFYYYSPAKLMNLINPFRVMLDSYGQYWVTTYPVDLTSDSKGLIVLRPSGNVLDINSTSVLSINSTKGLISNNTTAIAEDKDYTVWIGTDKGLQSYNGILSEKYEYPEGPKGVYIKDIHIDRFNNKWIATAEGVSLLTSNGNWVYYTKENSRLVDNNIVSITSDADGRYIYFGSYSKGLSRLKNPLAAAAAGEKVTAYPNPFIVGQHDFVSFLSVPDKSYIAIMTVSGEIVRKISVSNITSSVIWDGKNSKGQTVASGIYLYHVYPSESAMTKFKGKTGKIAVIRK